MIKKLIIGFLVIAGSIGSTGCHRIHEPLSILRMSVDICDLPCWMGITPGETSYEEAVEIVERLKFISSDGYLRINEDPSSISWGAGDGSHTGILFSNGIVSSIFFNTSNTKLGDVIRIYGPPEYYTTVGDEGAYWLDLLFPQVGLVFTAGQTSPKPITADMIITNAYYVLPGAADEFHNEYLSFLKSLGTRIEYINGYYPWEGFGVCPQGLLWDDMCEE